MAKVPLQRAIELYGSQKKLGIAVGFSQNAIYYAKTTGHVMPLMAFRIHAATRGRVSYAALLDIKRQMKLARKRVNGGRK